MTPQSDFMIVAKIDPTREAELRRLLDSMNRAPGAVDPLNALIPFGQFERLHFARIVILDDQTLDDITDYGLRRIDYPLYLVFLGDIDGPSKTFLGELAQRSGDGLRRIFSHCQGCTPNADLLTWMMARSVSPAANYVNWIGRTVRQVREEEALRQSMENFIQEKSSSMSAIPPRQVRDALKKFVAAEQQSGRIPLTAPESTPLGWQLRNLFHLAGIPLLLLILSPLLLLYLPFFLIQLRRREKSERVSNTWPTVRP